jgi:hypothetical protein
MRACDHQALQDGFWGEIVPGAAGGPKYVLKITAVYPAQDIFPPCTN